LGDLFYWAFNQLFTSLANPVVDIPTGATSTGFLQNIGADCNFSRAFDPAYISGVVFYKVHGLETINRQDYLSVYPQMKQVNPNYLLRFMKENRIIAPSKEITIDLLVSDMRKIKTYEAKQSLVIDEKPSTNTVRLENIESDANINYKTAPTSLRFEFISDLIHNNELNTIRRYVPLYFKVIIDKKYTIFDISTGLTEAIGDPIGFLAKNWFIWVLIMVIILFGAVVYGSIKKKEIIIPFGRSRRE